MIGSGMNVAMLPHGRDQQNIFPRTFVFFSSSCSFGAIITLVVFTVLAFLRSLFFDRVTDYRRLY